MGLPGPAALTAGTFNTDHTCHCWSTSHRFTMETPKLSVSSPTPTHKEAGEEPLLCERVLFSV